jgi:hypothetical protein
MTMNKKNIVPVLEDGHYYINHQIFSTGKTTMLNLINECQVKDNVATFFNKDGKVSKPVSELQTINMLLIKSSDVDVKDSLYHWFKHGNYIHKDKEFIEDTTLNTGTIYRERYWHFSLMIQPEENIVRFKITTL